MKWLLTALALLFAVPSYAQGTIPVAMNIQSDANGRPLSGALLYLYVTGTLATPQIAFQDVNLTQALPWPVPADQVGRIPMFYLPAGSVHARLTDAAGLVQFDYPNVLVVGGTTTGTGGGGGGPTIDPAATATTGDIKYRVTNESLSGWVILNGHTIGNAVSGASNLASATAQSLFVYLWTFCTNAHCPVFPVGRGATALADFNAGKQIAVPDMRGTTPIGRDCMSAPCAGRLVAGSIFSGDDTDTPGGRGGTATIQFSSSYLPAMLLPLENAFVPAGQGSHFHTYTFGQTIGQGVTGAATGSLVNTITGTNTSASNLPEMAVQGSVRIPGSGVPVPIMDPFILGSFYMKL